MKKTHKIYYDNVHQTEFEARVLECAVEEKTGRYRIILDKTAFFPEEGGQVADAGFLDGQKVLDVQIKDDIIYHYTQAPLSEGHTVRGRVDWAQRFDFMQQHTGEHILSGLVNTHYGYDNVGFHLGLSEVTLDFNKSLSLEQLRAIEVQANQAVWADLPVHVSTPSPDALSQMTYRSKIALDKDVRIVEIPGVDMCACCAPHVESTGQIGLIKIISAQSHRGGVRVTILCGNRALSDYTKKQDAVSEISALLSARPEDTPQAVKRLLSENAALKARAGQLQAKLLSQQIKDLPSPEETDHVVLFTGDLDSIALRNAVNTLTKDYPGFCAIFAGDDKSGYRYVIGSAGKDCRELAQRLGQRFQAKGGGSAPMVQGSISAPESDIRAFFQ